MPNIWIFSEWANAFKKHNLPTDNKEEIENLNSPIFIKQSQKYEFISQCHKTAKVPSISNWLLETGSTL